LIGAGASPDQLDKMMRALDFGSMKAAPDRIMNSNNSFVNLILEKLPFKLAKQIAAITSQLGLHSSYMIEKWVAECLIEITGISNRPVLFEDLRIPTSVVATDLSTSDLIVWGTRKTPKEEVARAVRASCSIPFYYQPVDGRYVDGGLLSNLPSFVYKANRESHYGRVLAYCLESDGFSRGALGFNSYVSSLAGAVVDGAQSLQVGLQDSVYCVNIPTGTVSATDFDAISEDAIKSLIGSGAYAVEEFVRKEFSHVHGRMPANVCTTNSESLNLLAGTVNRNVERVVISKADGKFVYDLFLTLLNWGKQGIKTKVYLPGACLSDDHSNFQYRLLKALGFEVVIVERLVCEAIVVHSSDMEACLAIVDTQIEGKCEKVVYRGVADSVALSAISSQVESTGNDSRNKQESCSYASINPTLCAVDETEYIKIMRGVPQYQADTVDMEIADIEISSVRFLTKYVRGHKFRQIVVLIDLYKSSKIELFSPSKIQFSKNAETYVGVPVVEEINGIYYVIEGNTRLFTMARLGISTVKCLIVKNVRDPLPSNGSYGIEEILLTEGDHEGAERYDKFTYSCFRPIEKTVRNPKTCLVPEN
jgi:hypothetical protein